MGLRFFTGKDIQEKIIERSLITKAKIRKNALLADVYFTVIYAIYLIVCVYITNGTRGFWAGFWQMTAILLIMGLSDRIFIEALWIGRAKACVIQGAEELRPYITSKQYKKNWIRTVVIYPIVATIFSGIMTIFFK